MKRSQCIGQWPPLQYNRIQYNNWGCWKIYRTVFAIHSSCDILQVNCMCMNIMSITMFVFILPSMKRLQHKMGIALSFVKSIFHVAISNQIGHFSALSIHLTLLKIWNRVYKFWVRSELQHDLFRSLCINAIAWRDIKSYALDWLRSILILSCNCMTLYQVIRNWLIKVHSNIVLSSTPRSF